MANNFEMAHKQSIRKPNTFCFFAIKNVAKTVSTIDHEAVKN